MMGDAWQAAKLRWSQTPPRMVTEVNGDDTTTIKEPGQPYATLLVDACNGFSELS